MSISTKSNIKTNKCLFTEHSWTCEKHWMRNLLYIWAIIDHFCTINKKIPAGLGVPAGKLRGVLRYFVFLVLRGAPGRKGSLDLRVFRQFHHPPRKSPAAQAAGPVFLPQEGLGLVRSPDRVGITVSTCLQSTQGLPARLPLGTPFHNEFIIVRWRISLQLIRSCCRTRARSLR